MVATEGMTTIWRRGDGCGGGRCSRDDGDMAVVLVVLLVIVVLVVVVVANVVVMAMTAVCWDDMMMYCV